MAGWVTLLDLKADRGSDLDEVRDDEVLRDVLDAARAFVERTHAGRYRFDDAASQLPPVPDDMRLGTCRLAARWAQRRRSPDGMVDMGELGSARVAGFDPDIDRMLRIGRYALPVIA